MVAAFAAVAKMSVQCVDDALYTKQPSKYDPLHVKGEVTISSQSRLLGKIAKISFAIYVGALSAIGSWLSPPAAVLSAPFIWTNVGANSASRKNLACCYCHV